LAVSDVVVRGSIDPKVRSSIEAWVGCIAGALDEDEYRSLLEQAGFTDVELVPTRVYELADAEQMLAADGIDIDELTTVDGQLMSAFVRAVKPPDPVRRSPSASVTASTTPRAERSVSSYTSPLDD
jgi:hypothetical protein